MSDIEGKIAFKIVGALLAAIEQRDPKTIDILHATLATGTGDPVGSIAHDAVGAFIESRSR